MENQNKIKPRALIGPRKGMQALFDSWYDFKTKLIEKLDEQQPKLKDQNKGYNYHLVSENGVEFRFDKNYGTINIVVADNLILQYHDRKAALYDGHYDWSINSTLTNGIKNPRIEGQIKTGEHRVRSIANFPTKETQLFDYTNSLDAIPWSKTEIANALHILKELKKEIPTIAVKEIEISTISTIEKDWYKKLERRFSFRKDPEKHTNKRQTIRGTLNGKEKRKLQKHSHQQALMRKGLAKG
jgi:hypothetical protein